MKGILGINCIVRTTKGGVVVSIKLFPVKGLGVTKVDSVIVSLNSFIHFIRVGNLLQFPMPKNAEDSK